MKLLDTCRWSVCCNVQCVPVIYGTMYLLLLYQSLTNQQVKYIYCSFYNGENITYLPKSFIFDRSTM